MVHARKLTLALSFALASFAPALAQEESAPSLDDLIGTWDVALYFSPNNPPSATVMTVSAVTDGTLIGTFYGTPFSEGRATVFDDEVIFSVATSDNSGPYLTSGRLKDGAIEGQTFAVGRDFLMPWRAAQQSPDE